MVNTADPAWSNFEAFIRELAEKPVQIAELFDDETVTPRRVADWRRGHGRPHLAELPRLSVAWTASAAHSGQVDELFFARMLGAVPDSGEALSHEIWLHRRVFELRNELRDLEMSVRHSDTTEATGAIVAATTATEKWAVAVQPAVEGPAGHRFHAADFLDFRRLYPGFGSTPSIEEEREQLENDLHRTLDRYGAVFAPHGPTQWASTADNSLSGNGTDGRLRYSVRHTIAERSPDRRWQHTGVPAVAVVSLTDGPWTADVAALVARMLGYGFFTTRKLAQGYRPNDKMPTTDELDAYRTQLHAEHLQKPWSRYVWAHRGTDVAPGRFLPAADVNRAGGHNPLQSLHVVCLRESPRLIRNIVEGNNLTERKNIEIHQARDSLSQQLREWQTRNGAVVHEIDCNSADAGPDDRRSPRWQRTFELALTAVQRILGKGWQDIIESHICDLQLKEQPDPVERCLVDWLGGVAQTRSVATVASEQAAGPSSRLPLD